MSSSQLRTVLDTHLPLASFTSYSSVNTKYWYNICTMLDQRRRYINHAAMGLVADLTKKIFGYFQQVHINDVQHCTIVPVHINRYYFSALDVVDNYLWKKTSQNYSELGTIFNFELVRESAFGGFVTIIISFLLKKNLMTRQNTAIKSTNRKKFDNVVLTNTAYFAWRVTYEKINGIVRTTRG